MCKKGFLQSRHKYMKNTHKIKVRFGCLKKWIRIGKKPCITNNSFLHHLAVIKLKTISIRDYLLLISDLLYIFLVIE